MLWYLEQKVNSRYCIYSNKEINSKGNKSNKEIHASVSGTIFLETWDLSKISRPNLKKKNTTSLTASIGSIFWNKISSCHGTFNLVASVTMHACIWIYLVRLCGKFPENIEKKKKQISYNWSQNRRGHAKTLQSHYFLVLPLGTTVITYLARESILQQALICLCIPKWLYQLQKGCFYRHF